MTRLIGGPFSRDEVQARLVAEIETARAHGVQYWPMFLRANGEHVGCCGLRPYRLEQRIYEIGFHVRRAHWGNHPSYLLTAEAYGSIDRTPSPLW